MASTQKCLLILNINISGPSRHCPGKFQFTTADESDGEQYGDIVSSAAYVTYLPFCKVSNDNG